MTYSICCHTRDFNEINQFIEHHLNLGFDRIIIYDNMSINPVKYINEKVNICYDVIIGAGAVVIKDIVEPGTYVGCPAKKIK